jgi:hypothetical protein
VVAAGAGAVPGAGQEALEAGALQLRVRLLPAQVDPPGPHSAGVLSWLLHAISMHARTRATPFIVWAAGGPAAVRWRRLCTAQLLPCADLAPAWQGCADLAPARTCCSAGCGCADLSPGCDCLWVLLQGVATELTRDAYETHARIALEAADLAEFRQCLARLKQLYRAGVSNFLEVFGYKWILSPLGDTLHSYGRHSVLPASAPAPALLQVHCRAAGHGNRTGLFDACTGPISRRALQQAEEASTCWC